MRGVLKTILKAIKLIKPGVLFINTGKFSEFHLSSIPTLAKPPVEKATGEPVIVTPEKMSKSKHNGVDPQVSPAYSAKFSFLHIDKVIGLLDASSTLL